MKEVPKFLCDVMADNTKMKKLKEFKNLTDAETHFETWTARGVNAAIDEAKLKVKVLLVKNSF